MTPTYAEFCAGYGGLGLAVEEVFGAELAWYSEFEAAPSAIMAHHWPGVSNHGDMTTIDFATVEPVDILSGGTPCQDLSHAGRRAGMRTGTRSGLWESMREAIATIRPKYVVWENVRGAYSAGASSDADSEMEPLTGRVGAGDGQSSLRALGRVLGDLADLGFDAEWRGLRAADVGAPHGRFRVFVLATRRDVAEAHDARRGEQWWPLTAQPEQPAAEHAGDVVPDTGSQALGFGTGLRQSEPERLGRGRPYDDGSPTTAQPEGVGRVQGRPEHARIERGPDAAERGTPVAADAGSAAVREYSGEPSAEEAGTRGSHGPGHPAGERPAVDWGPYAPAIARWEAVRGAAPAPTELTAKGKHRLSADFAAWMMGIPAGWVTDPAIGISRNEQLKAIGNGVVPQQAAAALRDMLAAEQPIRLAA